MLGALIGMPAMAGEAPTSEVTSEVVSEELEPESDVVISEEEVVEEDSGLTSEEIQALEDEILNMPIVKTILTFSGTAAGTIILTVITQLCRSFFTGKKTKALMDKITKEFNDKTDGLFSDFLETNLKPVIDNFAKALSSNSEAQAKLAQIQILSKTDSTEAQIAVIKLVSQISVGDEKTQQFCNDAIKEIERKAKKVERKKAETIKVLEKIGSDDGTQI